MFKVIKTAVMLLFVCFMSFSQANTTTSGQYQVNHIAYNSTFLSQDIAKLYGITRAENLAVINISVQDINNQGKGVKAEVKGTAANLIRQIKNLKFREIPSGDSIYYISDYRFSEADALTFKLTVQLADGTVIPVEWQQTFYKQ